jgi:hypothetical protein
LDLFTWNPGELLTSQDQRLLRRLETLCEGSSQQRRGALDNYLEGLGMEAIAFARRFEEVTSIEAMGLADDLPGAAAMLGTFRLLERGKLGMEEAVDLLRRSLRNLSPSWIEGVRTITANALMDADDGSGGTVEEHSEAIPVSATGTSVLDALSVTLLRSFDAIRDLAWDVSVQFSQMDWARLIHDSTEGKTANQGGADRF